MAKSKLKASRSLIMEAIIKNLPPGDKMVAREAITLFCVMEDKIFAFCEKWDDEEEGRKQWESLH